MRSAMFDGGVPDEDGQQLGGLRLVPPLPMSGQPWGEATVRQPELAGNAVNRYTTYLVSGTLEGGISFSARKRYSDFGWLRKALAAHFPGVFVPPLPRKQMSGRFEDVFVEARRTGLEEFLQRLLRIKPIAVGTPLLRSFLEASPGPMLDDLKKSYDKRSPAEMATEFKSAFADHLARLDPPPDDRRLSECRVFVDRQLNPLRQLSQALHQAVDTQRKATAAAIAVRAKLEEVCSGETAAMGELGVGEQPRVDLLSALTVHTEVIAEAPAMHQEIILAAVERELDDVEAMQEALLSLDTLRQRLMDSKRKVDFIEASQRKVQDGNDQPSTLGKIFKHKDKAGKMEDLHRDHERASTEAMLVEEWYNAARTIASRMEMDSFLVSKVDVHLWSRRHFSLTARATARQLAAAWEGITGLDD